jgi:hypothetical protein
MSGAESLADLLAQYREAAEGTADPEPQVSNKWYDAIRVCYKKLRQTEEGRAGIVGLLSDPSPHVRMAAAAHSLMWSPGVAREVLEALRDSEGTRSFEAKWTLKEYDEGNLSFD